MSTVAPLRQSAFPRETISGDALDRLLEQIERNRFLPVPDQSSIFIGDGDYRQIGREFLRYFIELGQLTPDERVLDVGCGIGRMAVPLTQYLNTENGRYEGIDPVASGVEWCSRTITPAYPNFRFAHVDIAHALYNPKGCISGDEVVLPFLDASFDLVVMTSVVTHLPADEIQPYFTEISRLLAPGGRLFLTAFVIDERSTLEREGRDPRLGFKQAENGPSWHVDPKAPLGAVAFDDGFLDVSLKSAGLEIALKQLGHWRGGQGAQNYQDIFVAVKSARRA